MQKPNLILYESQMKSILKHCRRSKEPTTAEQMMIALFNYYLDGEIYDGENDIVDMFMESVYPLIDKQQENYTKKVESVISNEDFAELAESGKFNTQRELADYITKYYGEYGQSAVSKRLSKLGIKLTKKSAVSPNTDTSPSSSLLSPDLEQQILQDYKNWELWGYNSYQIKQKMMETYKLTSEQADQVMGNN